MEKTLFKKQIANWLAIFILIFITVFLAVSILDAGKAINNDSFVLLPLARKENSFGGSCREVNRKDSILIDKIGIEASLVFPDESEGPGFEKALKAGVIVYPRSALPGEKGVTTILGHSAPLGWPKFNYDWIFSDLDHLETGDRIFVFYEGCQYAYRVFGKYFLDKGDELPGNLEGDSGSVLVLISCWPPGKDTRRIAVAAALEN